MGKMAWLCTHLRINKYLASVLISPEQMLIFYTQDFCTQYIDDFDELPFDLERTCRHHVERIVLASEPWQQWGMDVRSIYRWENPWRTGKWLALYIVLWQTSHVMGFLVSILRTADDYKLTSFSGPT